MFVESTVRTNKLYCSNCGEKIYKGDDVIFELNERRKMESVFCEDCKSMYESNVIEDSMHPHDSYSLGQW